MIQVIHKIDALPEELIVFDTRDLVDEIYSRTQLKNDIEDAFELLLRNIPKEGVFLLFNTIHDLSIVDIFNEITSQAKRKKNDKLKIYVNSERTRDYLINHIPPYEPLMKNFVFHSKLISIVTGNITEFVCDVIVASNTRLILGGGVSGAIREKAGHLLQNELNIIAKSKNLNAGDVVITPSYNMENCKSIIHAATVEGSQDTVRKAVRNSLDICLMNRQESIAFPALGAGTGGLDVNKCAVCIVEEIMRFCADSTEADNPKNISIVLWTTNTFYAFKNILEKDNNLEPVQYF